MKVDLMSSVIYDDPTIDLAMQHEINAKYTAAQREQLSRGTAAMKKELHDFYATMSGIKASLVADRDLLKATLAHEQAVALLATPALDPKAVDADGKLLYPTFKDMSGTVQPNPAIEADTASRATAKGLIKTTTTTAVKALAKKRLPPKVAPVV